MGIFLYPDTTAADISALESGLTGRNYASATFLGHNAPLVTTAGTYPFDTDYFTGETVIEHSSTSGMTFNSSNGRFTAVEAGIYEFFCRVSFLANATDAGIIWLEGYKNATKIAVDRQKFQSGSGSTRHIVPCELRFILDMAATDYVYFFVDTDASNKYSLLEGQHATVKEVLGL